MQKVMHLAAAATFLIAAGTTVHASTDGGAFIRVNGGSSHINTHELEVRDDNDRAYGLLAGYRWNTASNLEVGVEAGYTELGKLSQHESTIGPSVDPFGNLIGYHSDFTYKAKAALVGATGRWEWAPRWALVGHAGIARSHITSAGSAGLTRNGVPIGGLFENESHVSSTHNGEYAGVGVGFDVTSHIAVSANYDHYWLKSDNWYGGQHNVGIGVWGIAAEFRM